MSTEGIELWGHEYVRHLSGEVVQEFNSLPEEAGKIWKYFVSVLL